MLKIFQINFGKSMLVSFTIQQMLVAASSWALVNFINDTASPQTIRVSTLAILLLIAVSPYIPGFIANYFFHMWSTFSRSYNIQYFTNLIDGKKQWTFSTKQRDQIFALQREHLSLLEETTRFFYLNFPVVLNLIFNSIAIGFLLGTDILFGMLVGLLISTLQFFLIPLLTGPIQKEKQECVYEAEKSILGSWQVLTLKNQPFFRISKEHIYGKSAHAELLAFRIFRTEAITNILVLTTSFCPLTWLLINKFTSDQLDQVFFMSLAVLIPRVLQIFNMSSNLIIAGQSWQTLRIKWDSFQQRLSSHTKIESIPLDIVENKISIIEVNSGNSVLLADILAHKINGRFLVKGPNGSGKSTLCLNLKEGKQNAFYLPAKYENPHFITNGSTGENKLIELKWLHEHHLEYSMILLDEWDANLDALSKSISDALIQDIAQNCLVFEVRH